jgi:hypothetical protein
MMTQILEVIDVNNEYRNNKELIKKVMVSKLTSYVEKYLDDNLKVQKIGGNELVTTYRGELFISLDGRL